ncbi:hypothetical protein BU16DRAFT_148533 [Lophium mytilinum]|uniref:Uncharacterized protein n=1 Tax=Lophium mytilinum TaxID=390894 RepID=A0A6A6QE72_9PEZI|nr:hypothetical protein BU16DRAFT_148533 [Lophium mytilinum]
MQCQVSCRLYESYVHFPSGGPSSPAHSSSAHPHTAQIPRPGLHIVSFVKTHSPAPPTRVRTRFIAAGLLLGRSLSLLTLRGKGLAYLIFFGATYNTVHYLDTTPPRKNPSTIRHHV